MLVACIKEVANLINEEKHSHDNLTHLANIPDSEVNNRNRLQEGCTHEDSTWLQDSTYLSHLHIKTN
jgi:hypothetical protein